MSVAAAAMIGCGPKITFPVEGDTDGDAESDDPEVPLICAEDDDCGGGICIDGTCIPVGDDDDDHEDDDYDDYDYDDDDYYDDDYYDDDDHDDYYDDYDDYYYDCYGHEDCDVGEICDGEYGGYCEGIGLLQPCDDASPFELAGHLDFEGEALTVTFADLDQDGDAELLVGTTVGLTLVTGGADPTATSVDLGETLDRVESVTAGDFDGDSILDVAALDDQGGLIVLQGDGAGGLTLVAQTEILAGPSSIAALQYNGDGLADLAVHYAAGAVHVRNGDGAFGFGTGWNLYGGSTEGTSLSVGRANDDTFDDVLVGREQAVSLFLGDEPADNDDDETHWSVASGATQGLLSPNANGSDIVSFVRIDEWTLIEAWRDGVRREYGLELEIEAAASGDVDGDGDADLLFGGSQMLMVLPGEDADANVAVFTCYQTYDVSLDTVVSIASGDLDGDGADEIALTTLDRALLVLDSP